MAQQMANDPAMLNPDYPKGLSERDIQGRRTWVDKAIACTHLYADCDDDVASAACARLLPQALYPYSLPCSLERLPGVRSTYVVCAEDLMVNPDWSKKTARERLNAEVIEMPGSHSPMLSRPAELAEGLHSLA
jgi:pimeloyl-ACP methyl ester carboxylesterase